MGKKDVLCIRRKHQKAVSLNIISNKMNKLVGSIKDGVLQIISIEKPIVSAHPGNL